MIHDVIINSDLYVCFLLHIDKKSIRIFFQSIEHNWQLIIDDEILIISKNWWIR
jgi:hypothetical protein